MNFEGMHSDHCKNHFFFLLLIIMDRLGLDYLGRPRMLN